MIGQLAELDMQMLVDFASSTLLQTLIALVVAGGIGWIAGGNLARRLTDLDSKPGWLLRFPGQAIWLLGAIVLPFVGLSWVVELIILTLLLIPPFTLLALRVLRVEHEEPAQQKLDRQATLKDGWRDTGMVAAAYLLSGFAYHAVVPDASRSVTDHLSELPLALIIGLAAGGVLGWLLGQVNQRAKTIVTRRQNAGDYSRSLSVFSVVTDLIAMLPTQFHGTPLTGVLVISAGALPFTRLPQIGVLAILIALPVISAVLSAILVHKPMPNEPDEWHHWRLGLMNVVTISFGYLVGAAMLIPLEAQHTWMLEESDEVMRQLGTHLELTFIALGISMALGIVGGIASSRIERLRTILINLGNIGRTIPSLAVLALALPIFGVGRDPSLVALVFIGTLPILVNTSVGIISVTEDMKEAARGMGMKDWQVLFRVEIPVAIPVIMAGIRTSAVLVVASATLAGFVGGGGLGALIIRGDGSGRDDILITGAVLATILSVFLEYFFGWLEIVLTPRGLREA